MGFHVQGSTAMRIAEVIGTVTLSKVHPTLVGARFVVGVPLGLQALARALPPDGEDLIILESLGAGAGQLIGFSEGGEAAAPFLPERKPVDAFCACILDQVIV
jgi:microcompartment protein CcmK/EutM